MPDSSSNSREVRVIVDKDGSTKMDFTGYVGKECLDSAANIRERLARLGITLEQTYFVAKPELDEDAGQLEQEQQQGQRQPGKLGQAGQ